MRNHTRPIDRAVTTSRNVVVGCTLGITAILLGAALIPGEAQPAAVPAAATAQAAGDQGGGLAFGLPELGVGVEVPPEVDQLGVVGGQERG